ncbi:MAG: S8 family peptidase [Bacteroidetes bacterium]|nr:S8 family peptidase [Bacteroidota bacterium]
MEKSSSHRNFFIIPLIAVTFLIITGSNNFTYNFKLGKVLNSQLSSFSGNQNFLVWVTFRDKGSNVSDLLDNPQRYLTERAIQRRMKVKPADALVDYTDIPLNESYVTGITQSGLKIKNRSKWFNSISCYADRNQIEELASKDYVSRIDLVRTFRKDNDDIEFKNNVQENIEQNSSIENDAPYVLNYGNSINQMELINAPTAHDSGYYGQGVIVASFDAGFDNLQHPCFDSLRARGFRSYDFVNHDTIVGNENGQMGEGSHGTETLSLVGGYKPGSLISPAFRSSFILAKTENTDSETPVEEDNWIAAAEWVDSLGADVITSSVGYLDMDPGSSHSYDWTWMNGDSCVITIGADLAVNKGIIVCNSAGNEGYNASHNTLIAPADGDSVITVGSVNSNRNRSSFSSVGLTTDGRIKPDLCALGSGNVVASPGAGNTGYTSGSGTSFSCPMTAGVCAVILSANYSLTPMQVLQVLRQTADSSATPNRLRGWGLINCWEALKLGRTLTGVNPVSGVNTVPKGFSLSQNYPNPFNPATVINYELGTSSDVKLKVYDVLGNEIATLVNKKQDAGFYSVKFDGSRFSSGIYFYTLTSGNFAQTKKMLLVK